MTESPPQNSRESHDAAIPRDDDCVIVQEALIGREPTQLEWSRVPSLAALKRIEQRLAAGKAHAEIVEACIEAGHIEAVKP